ncbi:MAG: hypothetical protein UW11_C0036G0006 [Parcubacteria group bacterium GW2011_GWA2_43_9b]|uniref:Type II secretion system protein J n=1 Tax=Candidatus Portnoybacteria bacterium RIFCSPLOWO2_02_FULL_39_11 TaxID=1802001 RepID=A0A1G2FSJ6_9BACT|nr:MAG: hypothetical protein UW11_C0036G0006 [Parcubacteria group bacterium GW2011_GWA2_43_9b]OGZ40598.1 MAG: hypothetical protein A3B04_02515 [Candidatus Portnoybacteria bacterium RIFCSPLOWO2_02_FULL_39_11]
MTENFQFSTLRAVIRRMTIFNFQFLKRQPTVSGFTLLEMLIYVALVATVMSSVVFFGIWVIQVGVKSRINSEVMGNARSAMETMVYEIKKSQSVYAPTSVFDSSLGQLSLEQTKDAGSDESSGFIDFFICGQALCLKREKINPVALTNNSVRVTSLIFSQRLNSTDNPSIQIQLRVESASSTKPEYTGLIDLTTTANLRFYNP